MKILNEKIAVEDTANITPDTILLKLLIQSLNPMQWGAEPKNCKECKKVMTLKTIPSKVFGNLQFYPADCNECRKQAYDLHIQEEKKQEWIQNKAKCAGLQNIPQKHLGILPMLQMVTKTYDWQESFIDYAMRLCSGQSSIGAYVKGNPGGGKTFLAKILHNELLGQYKNSCFIQAVDLTIMLRKISFKDDYRQILNHFKNVEVLIVDDYGTQKNTDFIREAIFSIFNSRYEQKKTTLITTNLDESEAEEAEPRLFSRLKDKRWMQVFDFQAVDLRQAEIF